MDIIHIPRLRNKELQTVGEDSLRICSGITEVKPAYDKADAKLKLFIEGMLKEKIDGQSKTNVDKQRDKYTSGVTPQVVKIEVFFPKSYFFHEGVNKIPSVCL